LHQKVCVATSTSRSKRRTTSRWGNNAESPGHEKIQREAFCAASGRKAARNRGSVKGLTYAMQQFCAGKVLPHI
jgi:hypothetical protein